jgi:acetyl-CoA acetyltransferase
MPISSVPVVIGVGEFINRSTKPEDAKEPLDLILSAVNNAIGDSQTALKTQLLSSVDSIDVVLSWTWPYGDLPGLLARRLGIDAPKRAATSPHGGNQPAKVFDEAARRIARGEARVALLAGGEALASRTSRPRVT